MATKKPSPTVRYEVLVRSGRAAAERAGIDDLDLDRLPDHEGAVRALVDADELAALEERGLDVERVGEIAVAPLDPSLVARDDDVRGWLESELAPLRGKGAQ
jgi:hypothetical protein